MDEGFLSGLGLALLLVALFYLFNERGADKPALPALGLGGERLPPKDTHPDPLDFTPDVKASVLRLRDEIGRRTGNEGAARDVEELCRRFAMMVFRRLGREPDRTSKQDAERVADDLAALRADVINAIQALYISVHRDRRQLVLDEITDDLMEDMAEYIRAVRHNLGDRNMYESGRDFPSPWKLDADPNYDMLLP